jgi:threonine dehydratase
MALAFLRLKIVLEPGGAVALGGGAVPAQAVEGDAVIVVASGGNVDAGLFARALARHFALSAWRRRMAGALIDIAN